MDERTPRAKETRQLESRDYEDYTPGNQLPDPDPQDGWVFRWVRTSVYSNPDVRNVSYRFREKWVPVLRSEHPEMSATLMSDQNSRFPDNIEVGGLLLCKAPEELVERRRRYYSDKNSQQIEAVESNYMRENDPRMPLLKTEKVTRVSFGSNSRRDS